MDNEFNLHVQEYFSHICIYCMLSCFSHVRLYVTRWTVAHQAPLSMRFSTQEYWSGLPCPPQINWLPKGNLERWGDNKVSGPETFPAGFFFNLSRLEYSDIVKLLQMIEKDNDFPGGPVVKTPCCTAGDEGLIPSWGTKIPHSTGAWPKKGKRESLMVHFVEKS